MRLAGTLVALLAMARAAAAQDDGGERLKRLEEQGRRQQQEIDQLKQQESDFSATFTDGFHLRSGERFDLHVGGRFEEQVRHVLGRPDASRTVPDTFYVREAFLTLDGTIYREFGFKINGDFTTSPAGPGANLEEAFLEWKRTPEFTLRFGQFKTPNSQEILTSTLFTDCIERSMLSRFVPNVELGMQAAGKIEGGLFGYQVAVINGRAQPSSPGRSTQDNNDPKDLMARLTTTPLVQESGFLLRQLRLGIYGSIGNVSDVPMASQFDLTTTELALTFLDSTSGVLDGRRTRAGLELSWAIGPLSLRGEYLLRRDTIRDSADTVEETLHTRAWYGQATWALTGEEKVVESRIIPSHPFNPGGEEFGAVELVFRVASAEVGEAPLVAVGNSLAGQSHRVTAFTLGVNWYPVKNVRLSANAIHEDYRDEIDFGNGVRKAALSGLLLRFQLDF